VADVQAGGFTAKATKFFTDLERDNSKDYWTAKKSIFENEVKEPMAALVDCCQNGSNHSRFSG